MPEQVTDQKCISAGLCSEGSHRVPEVVQTHVLDLGMLADPAPRSFNNLFAHMACGVPVAGNDIVAALCFGQLADEFHDGIADRMWLPSVTFAAWEGKRTVFEINMWPFECQDFRKPCSGVQQ